MLIQSREEISPLGETRVIFNQTDTQESIERQYRVLSQISLYLDSVSSHQAILRELREYQELNESYTIEEIAEAMSMLNAKDCPPFEKMAYLNAWGIERTKQRKRKP